MKRTRAIKARQGRAHRFVSVRVAHMPGVAQRLRALIPSGAMVSFEGPIEVKI